MITCSVVDEFRFVIVYSTGTGRLLTWRIGELVDYAIASLIKAVFQALIFCSVRVNQGDGGG